MCMLHMDTDWTQNIPYLKELPSKKCIANYDSITDIFKAKEILHGHMCIMVDVPPSLSSLGTHEEVRAYCEKLIDVVGKDGGFILSSGCEVPGMEPRSRCKTAVFRRWSAPLLGDIAV